MSIRASLSFPLLGLVAVLAGCGGGTATGSGADTTDTTSQTTAALTTDAAQVAKAPAMRMHRGPGGGPDLLLHAALKEPIGLTDAQRTAIQAAMDAARPKAPPAPDAARMKSLAAAIRAGSVDASLLAPPADDTAHAARVAASAKALDTLFTTLSKTQRVALVDAISKRAAEHGQGDAPPDGPARAKMGHGPGEGRGPMGHLMADLDLTDAQKTALHASFERTPPTDAERAAWKTQHEAHRAEMQKRLQAFASDSFDAAAFLTPSAADKPPAAHGDPMAKMLSTLVPLLDSAQREKLATRIEQGPPKPPSVAVDHTEL